MVAVLGSDSLVTSANGLSDQVRCFGHTIKLSARTMGTMGVQDVVGLG